MRANPMFEAAKEALTSMRQGMPDIGAPPGAQAVPLREQQTLFIDALPDLVKWWMRGENTPKVQEIERMHGAGSAQQYLDHQSKQIAQGRQRRGRL